MGVLKRWTKKTLSTLQPGRVPQLKLPVGHGTRPCDIVSPERAFRFLLTQAPVAINHQSPDSVRQILSLLRPMNVAGGVLVRKGHDEDGGYVMLDSGLANTVAYSLGISDEVSWDLDMVRCGCQVFQYDHTIPGPPLIHPNLHFAKVGIAPQDSVSGGLRTLPGLIKENGHESRTDLILKMDIEEAEWEVLEAIDTRTLEQFSQIVLELHFTGFRNVADAEVLDSVLAVLRRLNQTHQVIHIHANNCGRMGIIGGVSLPEGLEVTYLRKGAHEFSECRELFPRSLDKPNNPCMPDYFLGAVGQV